MEIWSCFVTLESDHVFYAGDYDLKVMRQEYYISQQKHVSRAYTTNAIAWICLNAVSRQNLLILILLKACFSPVRMFRILFPA
jgi:hypothetical protein